MIHCHLTPNDKHWLWHGTNSWALWFDLWGQATHVTQFTTRRTWAAAHDTPSSHAQWEVLASMWNSSDKLCHSRRRHWHAWAHGLAGRHSPVLQVDTVCVHSWPPTALLGVQLHPCTALGCVLWPRDPAQKPSFGHLDGFMKTQRYRLFHKRGNSQG